jgi:16S rRNA (guanine527-N7)-methyltransferase
LFPIILPVTPEQETLLRRYTEDVVSSPLHLTADRDIRQFWTRHVQDAVKLLESIPLEHRKPGTRVLDVGSGNGIPGIPVAILNPEWSIELLDSDNKKCGFLDMFCKKYAIKNCRVIVGRAEVLGKAALRQSYDVVFSRALSKLRTALELASCFAKVGGLLIVPHGTSWESELKDAAFAMEILGLKLLSNFIYDLDNVKFCALTFLKISETPAVYPRPTGVPGKKPL